MRKYIFLLFVVFYCLAAQAQVYEWKTVASATYPYKYVTHDPMQARFYTLKNGLTVILSVNHKEPRISVRMAVRTGSNNDPKDHTGLAHYLEHMLFKGTSAFGSLDREKEIPYLDQIDALYEKYNHSTAIDERKDIYHQIDSVSGIASRYAIANEYDKLMSNIGTQGSNAHTSVEETVYEEDLPSNAVDKFLAVQAERFRYPIFRLFHTELEAVYEEKNRTLDNDAYKMYEALNYYIFPTHNYGQQTTIGTIAHLKNPSLLAIRDYYHKYYVPGNMGIIMSGEFNPDEMIRKIDLAFSYMQAKPFPEYHPAPEKPLLQPIVKDIFGPSAENMEIGFRTPASTSRDALVLNLIGALLSNGTAGMLDLDLNIRQKVLSANAGLYQYKDYGTFVFIGTPKEGQSLEQVKDLLFAEIRKLKKGDFEDALIKAVVANSKLYELQSFDKNYTRVYMLTDEFIKDRGTAWRAMVASDDEQEKMTKKEIVAVANKYFGNGYVLLYKRKGEDKNVVKVDKPPITPVETNAGKRSAFVEKIEAMPVSDVQPMWLDFQKDIGRSTVNGTELLYARNKDNELFNLYYRFDMGTWNNKLLPVAASYLQYLGTDKMPAREISRAFYNLACTFNISVTDEVTTITLSGLQRNFDKAAVLFENILTHCRPDTAALSALKDRMIKSRANDKLEKYNILRGLMMYARYGAKNPYNAVLSDEEINQVAAADLVNILHDLFSYRHIIIYYGPKDIDQVKISATAFHPVPPAFTAYPPKANFTFAEQASNQVLFAHYDMVQSEIYWIRNEEKADIARQPAIDLFNHYFGGGMGSVVFQTIRESKALAYSTFAQLVIPNKTEDRIYELAYIGCQADKMHEAIMGMNALLDTLPVSDNNLLLARSELKKDIQTERITGDGIIFSYLAAKQKGIDYDFRKKEYESADAISMQDVKQVHDSELSGKPFTYCIVGSDKKVSMEELRKIGDVKKLTLEEIFGY